MEVGIQNELTVAVVIPTYCEAENIKNLIRDLQELKLNLMIVVIDDSSPDGTADIVKKLQKEYDNIHLISRPEKLGLGTAITTGFGYILGLRKIPDYIVTMDADYSHNPRDIPRLVDVAKKGCDLVIGSRYVREGKVIRWSLRRRFISRLANLAAAMTMGARLHDYTSGFRCYSKRYVKDVLPSLRNQTYEIQIETVKQARRGSFRIKEIPITFVNRKRGRSKLTSAEFQAFLFYVFKALFSKKS